MRDYNYVATSLHPTSVTHSRIGNFTSPHQLNLIIAKCTRIEIHQVSTDESLQLILDVPIYGRIAVLELFRPDWDTIGNELITRDMGDVSNPPGIHVRVENQIGIIDPQCRLVALHLIAGYIKVIPFDNKGHLKEAFDIWVEENVFLDMKFLYGCTRPTIVALYQDRELALHVKTYEVSLEDKSFVEGPWSRNNVDDEANLLISVPPPFCGVLIVGEERVAYYRADDLIDISIIPSIIKAYGRVDADGTIYYLGDLSGILYLLVIEHEDEMVTGLKLEELGITSIASTISSCLGNSIVYIGSSFGDSQLIKINSQSDAYGSKVEVLEHYVNLGPIADLCLVDSEREGQGQVVTCSGAFKDGSLRIVRRGIEISELASVELQGIKGVWSVRSHTDDLYHKFLVVSFVRETLIFAMSEDNANVLEAHEFIGFNSEEKTLFCHEAMHDQLVQVTSSSVRLMYTKSGELTHEWCPPAGRLINVATANATHILLATEGVGHLFYLAIGDGSLKQISYAKLDKGVSCIDMKPTGEDFNFTALAAVGMWIDNTVKLFSLPDLIFISEEKLGGDIVPRAVLFSSLEGIPYLFCALGDGSLQNFLLDTGTCKLTEGKQVPCGNQPATLITFSSKNQTRVFVASDRPTLICSSNKKLMYSDVSLKEATYACPFYTASFPDSFAVAIEDRLIVGTADDTQKLYTLSIPLNEQALHICHQQQSHTFAICSVKDRQPVKDDPGMHFIRLLDDQTFKITSSYALDQFESGCSILNCSFLDDDKAYYCVGTGAMQEEDDSTKGRILVFTVEDGMLELVAEKVTKDAVYSLNALSGKLLAGTGDEIELYKWTLLDDGTHELQFECEYPVPTHAPQVQTRGNSIVVGDTKDSISHLIYKLKESTIEVQGRDYKANMISAVEILDEEIFLAAENSFNLFTVRQRNSKDITETKRKLLQSVGEYHIGELVKRFQHGSLVLQLLKSDVGNIPTIIFGTANGVIGIIASIPQEKYIFIDKLQTIMRKVIKGIGGLSHEQWRSYCHKRKTLKATHFLDGDFIESFLNLERSQMEEISTRMDVPVGEIVDEVKELARLH